MAAWERRTVHAYLAQFLRDSFVGLNLFWNGLSTFDIFFAMITDDLYGTSWLSVRLHYSQPSEVDIEHHVRTSLPYGLEDTFS